MDASVKGSLAAINRSWKAFSFKGKPMTKPQVKAVLQYADKAGYALVSQITESEIDEVISKI